MSYTPPHSKPAPSGYAWCAPALVARLETPSPPPLPLTHEEMSAAYEVSQFTAPCPDPTALLAPMAKAKITQPQDRPHLVANGTFEDELRAAWTKTQGPFNAPLARQQFTTRIGFYGWDEAYFNLRNNAAQLELAHRTNPDDLLFATPNAHQGPPYSSAAVTVRKFENEPICLFWYPTYKYGALDKIFRWAVHIGPVVPIDQLNPIIPPNSSHWLLEYGAALLGDTFTPVTTTTVFIPGMCIWLWRRGQHKPLFDQALPPAPPEAAEIQRRATSIEQVHVADDRPVGVRMAPRKLWLAV
ncbi:hypothetical protein GGX14DRAFT_393072 [Mycena pura]|uniref:Uncharacterized protein n=1 Tax=Mycena pura TaxID=153505 RepID=A0AAD6YF81_9AGAR|nr:hypothetical protein GGX14DRAFT_393072 [Mycena pura]